MPEKENLSQRAAEDTVFENLGLDRADLGIEEDQGSGWEDEGQDTFESEEQVETPEPRPARAIPDRAEVKPDGRGNLVGPDGKVVARAGKEARLYQDLHRTKGQAQTLKGQVEEVTGRLKKAVEIGQRLHQELQTVKAQTEAIKQFGLDQSEHLSALRLYKELRDDTAKTLKNLLTRAAANGINIQELGTSGGIDPKSLLDMVRQEIGTQLNPLRERTEAEKKLQTERDQLRQQQERVQGEVNDFFRENPGAQEYLPVFTQTIKQFPNMSLGEIWARIQLHFERNPQDKRSTNSPPRRSLPSGRGAPPGGNAGDMAPVNETYESIIRDAMTKSGIV
jgi:hypothetical protein